MSCAHLNNIMPKTLKWKLWPLSIFVRYSSFSCPAYNSQNDVQVAQIYVQVAQNDVKVAQIYVQVAQNDVKVIQSEVKVVQKDVQVAQIDVVTPGHDVVTLLLW